MTYQEIKDDQPKLNKVFFAFSKEQLIEGKKKAGIVEGEKIYDGGMGSFGTKEGLKGIHDFYEKQEQRIKEECSPQDVYDNEFCNHECDYVGDDTEAIEIVLGYFGKERAKEVKRKYAYMSI